MSVKVAILGFAHGHVNTYVDQWVARPELGVTIVSGCGCGCCGHFCGNLHACRPG